MDEQAAAKLGEQVDAGAIISTAGTGKSMMRSGISGAIGGVAGSVATDALTAGSGNASGILGHAGLMYMAVGPTKVGFFTLKQGLLKSSVGDVLGVLRRDAVASMTIGGGALTSAMMLALTDGTTIALEVARTQKGRAERIAALFASGAQGPR